MTQSRSRIIDATTPRVPRDHDRFNVNGPSVLPAPGWMPDPPGRYLMFFAHHIGQSIRLAADDEPTGPWRVVEPDVLHVDDTPSDRQRHIASPDVHADDRRQRARRARRGEALASVGLYFYVASDPTSVLPIYGLVVAFGAARAFLMAVSRALPVDLAPEGARERVVALNVAGWQAGFIVGPVTFGFAFEIDPALPYLLAAGSSAAAIGLLMLVPSGDVQRAARGRSRGAVRARTRP